MFNIFILKLKTVYYLEPESTGCHKRDHVSWHHCHGNKVEEVASLKNTQVVDRLYPHLHLLA